MATRWTNLIHPSAIAFLLTVYLLSIYTVHSHSREIRPSDHGLSFQHAPAVTSPGMAAFFKGGGSTSASSSQNVGLPEARNSSDPFWSSRTGGLEHVRGEGGRHVRGLLLVASIVCGVVGLALMLAVAFAYLFQVRRRSK